jgi:hypothetical protein
MLFQAPFFQGLMTEFERPVQRVLHLVAKFFDLKRGRELHPRTPDLMFDQSMKEYR